MGVNQTKFEEQVDWQQSMNDSVVATMSTTTTTTSDKAFTSNNGITTSQNNNKSDDSISNRMSWPGSKSLSNFTNDKNNNNNNGNGNRNRHSTNSILTTTSDSDSNTSSSYNKARRKLTQRLRWDLSSTTKTTTTKQTKAPESYQRLGILWRMYFDFFSQMVVDHHHNQPSPSSLSSPNSKYNHNNHNKKSRVKKLTADFSDYNYFNFQEFMDEVEELSEPTNNTSQQQQQQQQTHHIQSPLLLKKSSNNTSNYHHTQPTTTIKTSQLAPTVAPQNPSTSSSSSSSSNSGDDEEGVIVAETNITTLSCTADDDDQSSVTEHHHLHHHLHHHHEEEEEEFDVDNVDDQRPLIFSRWFQVSFKVFVHILQYLSPSDLMTKVIPVCQWWRNIVLDEENDTRIWRSIAFIQQQSQQLSDHNFCGQLFDVDDFEMLRHDDQCVNPVFVHCGALWRNLCLFKELYNRLCELCFLHCFTSGEEHLFAEMSCEATRKAVFFGPRHVPVGKSTVIKSIALGRRIEDGERRRISPTTGLETTMLNALVDQTSFVRIQSLDTVMNTFQHSLRTAQGCAVQVYVFDLSNPLSLETLMQGFMYEFIKHPHGNARRLLVGLKQDKKLGKDLSNRAMQFAVENHLFYLECSSHTGYNIALLSRLIVLLSFPI